MNRSADQIDREAALLNWSVTGENIAEPDWVLAIRAARRHHGVT